MFSRMRTFAKRARKPRGIGKDGYKSLDLCTGCYAFHCDPMTMSRKFTAKVMDRQSRGLCVACGHSPCTCRSSLTSEWKDSFYI